MNYPCLVPKNLSTTPIHVSVVQEGISEDGESLLAFEADLMCNYQDTAKTILTEEKKLVQLIGRAFFVGDVAPDIPVISGGEVTIFGVKRQIIQGMKARNPDGTVNYTRLDLE